MLVLPGSRLLHGLGRYGKMHFIMERFNADINLFDIRSWGLLDPIFTCFSNRQSICISIGLSCLCALLMLVSSFLVRGRHDGSEAACSMYCFLGNLCSTVGAILSHQLALQVLLGVFMTILDLVNFFSILISLCLCWNSPDDRRRRMMMRRRRQNLLAVSGLLLLGGGGSYLTSKLLPSPIKKPITGRILLSDLQVNSDVLGCVLGLLSFVIAWTAKFPAVSRARRGEMPSKAHLLSGVLCSLAGVLYTAAILLYDTQPEFILGAMPWLLTATSCAATELLIIAFYWCRRSSNRRPRELSSDTESLLGSCSPSSQSSPRSKASKKHPLDEVPLHGTPKKKNFKMVDVGRYMDVNSQPVRKVCLKHVTLPRDGVPESQPLRRAVRVVRVDESCTSDSSLNASSPLSSDLECDFEEGNPWWNKTPKRQDRFPLQEWPKSLLPTPAAVCPCDVAGAVGQEAA